MDRVLVQKPVDDTGIEPVTSSVWEFALPLSSSFLEVETGFEPV